MDDSTAAGHADPQVGTVSVPMAMTSSGQPVIEVGIGDGPPQRVILDTGASESVLDEESLSSDVLARSREVEGAVVGAMGETGEGRRVVDVGFTVDRWRSPVVDATLLSLDPVAMEFGVPVVGILGLDVLATGVVVLDFVSKTVTLDVGDPNPGPVFAARGFHEHPVRRDDSGLVLLEVLVQGTPVTAVLDSGAAATVLNTDAARQAGVLIERPERGTRAAARGIGPGSVEVRACAPAEIRLGNCVLRDSVVYASDLPVFEPVGLGGRAAMLLGPQALRERVVALDVPRSRLYIFCKTLTRE